VNSFAPIIVNPAGGGTTGLTKADAGLWRLTGGNTYTGPTNVNGGTLQVNGNQTSANGNVTVASGGTLAGIGTVGGAISVSSSGNIAPGISVGTLTVNNNVTLTSGANYLWEYSFSGTISGAALNSGGSSGTGGQDNLTITGGTNAFFGDSGAVYRIIETGTPIFGMASDPSSPRYSFALATGVGSSQVNGTAGGLDLSPNLSSAPVLAAYVADGGLVWIESSGSGVYLNVAPVPEPVSVGLIAAASLGFGGLIRRKVRRSKTLSA